MVPTTKIQNSNGKVLAPVGVLGVLAVGKRQVILVTGVGSDKKTPLIVRESLVGMEISTIFTKNQLKIDCVPDGARLAYASEVIEALEAAKKTEAAENLRMVAGNELDMYIFGPGIFELR